MPRVDTLRWTVQQHEENFDIHCLAAKHASPTSTSPSKDPVQSTRKSSSSIIHRIRSNVSIQEIKNVPKIFKLLQTNKVYLTEHRWTEDVWDTVQLGFFLGLDPTFYDPIQAKQKVQKDISGQLPRSKPPKFEMTYATPSLKEGNFNVCTKAYAIEVQRCHAMELIKILKDTYMETKSFVQFQMKNKSPEAFGRTIMQQNRLFEANHVILLNYVGSNVMYYLMDRIMSIRGIKDIVPAPSVSRDGKYKIQVSKTDFHGIRKTLMNNLSQWYEEHVPDDAKATTQSFYAPPEVASIKADDHSSSNGAYMSSASIQTAFTYDSLLEEDNGTDDRSQDKSSVHKGQQRTWAQKASVAREAVPEFIIEQPAQSEDDDTNASHSVLAELAASRAEVDMLKQRLAQIEIDSTDGKGADTADDAATN
jgi:hypothetical protein